MGRGGWGKEDLHLQAPPSGGGARSASRGKAMPSGGGARSVQLVMCSSRRSLDGRAPKLSLKSMP